MTDNFPAFAQLVAASFQDLVKSPSVFEVALQDDVLWERYLASFPEGADPIFKTATEHDCRCCRHFIRRAGSVVTIDEDGTFRTIWSAAAEAAGSPYRDVAARLREIVCSASIADLYRVGEKELSFGAAQSRSLDKETGRALTWQHFYTGEIPRMANGKFRHIIDARLKLAKV